MGFAENLVLFATVKDFTNRSRIDKVMAVFRVEPLFDSQCIYMHKPHCGVSHSSFVTPLQYELPAFANYSSSTVIVCKCIHVWFAFIRLHCLRIQLPSYKRKTLQKFKKNIENVKCDKNKKTTVNVE